MSNIVRHAIALLCKQIRLAQERLDGELVIVTSAADGVSRPSDQHEDQADDEKDDADHHQNVSEGEGWYQAGQDQPEDDEDDSENNHDVDPLSSGVWIGSAVLGHDQRLKTSFSFVPDCLASAVA